MNSPFDDVFVTIDDEDPVLFSPFNEDIPTGGMFTCNGEVFFLCRRMSWVEGKRPEPNVSDAGGWGSDWFVDIIVWLEFVISDSVDKSWMFITDALEPRFRLLFEYILAED